MYSSFFQSLCVLGYCIFPVTIAALVNLFVHLFFVRLPGMLLSLYRIYSPTHSRQTKSIVNWVRVGCVGCDKFPRGHTSRRGTGSARCVSLVPSILCAQLDRVAVVVLYILYTRKYDFCFNTRIVDKTRNKGFFVAPSHLRPLSKRHG